MTRRSTVYDVARLAGVSIATVSFAFSQPERVRPGTLEAVLRAADELGYAPSASARGLAKGKTGAIGLYSFDYLIQDDVAAAVGAPPPEPDYRSFPLYVDEVQNGVALECRRRGYALMVGGGKSGPATAPIVDVAGRVDGLIAFVAGSLAPGVVDGIARRIPVVELGGTARDDRLRSVAVDNAGGMRRLTEHLLSAHGCRRPVYIGRCDVPDFVDRYRGFAAALGGAGLPVPDPRPSLPGHTDITVESVRACLAAGPLPDAFVCATDQEALVVLDELRRSGLAIPRQVAVTGFDGIVAGRLSRPTLTTVRQPMERIGRTAVGILAAMLDGDARPDPVPELPVELILRDSCGCGVTSI
ncbi:LacI family DNA-binding transcriptional regulator [Phytohabitans rumicis]|uniref:LacI family transcriptional regulator n=1 Tax=Phytohabitans rumicis TaxID=1076125 RepID=A0A6V8KP56_9ACTN|nr:LacI family DNA-binding transcriptional regulator [Phytohabitans rumicis]GFJ86942.1 LacI family transcriptional regulator [Phytohabitans rumicis]